MTDYETLSEEDRQALEELFIDITGKRSITHDQKQEGDKEILNATTPEG